MNQEQLHQHYQKLLHYILHRYHLSSRNEQYDDLYQELYLQLVAVAQQFDGDPLTDRYRFTAYAKTRLCWWMNDYFKQQRPPAVLLQVKDEPSTYMDTHQAEQFMNMAQSLLSEEEYEFLLYVLEEGISASEKAERLGISRKTYYQRKQKLTKKLHQIHDVLTP